MSTLPDNSKSPRLLAQLTKSAPNSYLKSYSQQAISTLIYVILSFMLILFMGNVWTSKGHSAIFMEFSDV